MMKVGQYYYVYGSENFPNRRITFYSDDQEHVWGTVERKIHDIWESPEKISEEKMILELESTSEKIRKMMEAREKGCSPIRRQEPFSKIPYDKKVSVINKLEPIGPYRISFINDIGKNPFFETIEHMNFFDPN